MAAAALAADTEIHEPRNPFTPAESTNRVVDHFPMYFSTEHAIREAKRLGIPLPDVLEVDGAEEDALSPPAVSPPPYPSPEAPSHSWSPVLDRPSGIAVGAVAPPTKLTDAEAFRELFREEPDDPHVGEAVNATRVLALPSHPKQTMDSAVHELRFALEHPMSLRVPDLEVNRVAKARENDQMFQGRWQPTMLDEALGKMSLSARREQRDRKPPH